MIVAIVFLMSTLFGGSSPAQMKIDVEKHVQDPTRAAQVVEILHEIEEELERYASDLSDITSRAEELNGTFETSPDQYAEEFQKVRSAMVRARTRLLDLRFEMKDHMTREEWEAVFPAPD